MLQKQRILRIASLGILLTFSFSPSRSVLRGQSNVRTFTLVTEVYGVREGEPPALRNHTTIAVRSDGTQATISTLPGMLGRAGEFERIIAHPDGRTVTFRPGISAKTTFGPRPEAAEARQARMTRALSNCAIPGFDLAGRETIAGEPVVELSGWDTKFWLAPNLGCEQLQYRVYHKAEGTTKLVTEKRTVSLVFGEPDPRVFEEPSSGYQEMKPSDVVRAYARKYGRVLEREEIERMDPDDRNYAGTLRHGGPSQPQNH